MLYTKYIKIMKIIRKHTLTRNPLFDQNVKNFDLSFRFASHPLPYIQYNSVCVSLPLTIWNEKFLNARTLNLNTHIVIVLYECSQAQGYLSSQLRHAQTLNPLRRGRRKSIRLSSKGELLNNF